MGWIRQHRAAAALGGVAVLAVVAWLAFGIFGVHTLFFDDEVDEAGPVFDSGATAPGDPADAPTTTAPPAAPSTSVPADPTASTTATTAPPTTAPPTTEASAPVVEQVATGAFIDRSHPASGDAIVLSDGIQTFLRFEDFATDNGPDLFVYLSRGTTADGPEGAFDDDFVNLGTLKGNIGDQNYEVPADVDVSEYSTVVIWCRRFAVAFGAADLA